MSYQLAFWRQHEDQLLPPQKVYERLLEGEEVAGVESIAADDFLKALGTVFPDAKWEPNGAGQWFIWVGPESMFEVTWSAAYVLVTMRPLDEGSANRLIDIASTLGMPLYDPQINERFTSSDQ